MFWIIFYNLHFILFKTFPFIKTIFKLVIISYECIFNKDILQASIQL